MPSKQCSGITSQGKRCRLIIKYNNVNENEQLYCHYHTPNNLSINEFTPKDEYKIIHSIHPKKEQYKSFQGKTDFKDNNVTEEKNNKYDPLDDLFEQKTNYVITLTANSSIKSIPNFSMKENFKDDIGSPRPNTIKPLPIYSKFNYKNNFKPSKPQQVIQSPKTQQVIQPPTCKCCFDELKSDNENINCGNISHSLCVSCFREYISTSLKDYRKTSVRCGGHPECSHVYSTLCLQKNLTPEMWNLFDKELLNQYLEQYKESIFECPLCHNYKEVIDNLTFAKTKKIQFDCKNCNKKVCVGCNHEHQQHDPCIRLKKDIRKRIEEIFTEERLRQCPKCHMEFIRQDGCSKMTCSKCQTKSCYVCKISIKDYSHFRKGICKMYTSEAEIENLSIENAKKKIFEEMGKTQEIIDITNEVLTTKSKFQKWLDSFLPKEEKKVLHPTEQKIILPTSNPTKSPPSTEQKMTPKPNPNLIDPPLTEQKNAPLISDSTNPSILTPVPIPPPIPSPTLTPAPPKSKSKFKCEIM
jgi:hypothetical protein